MPFDSTLADPQNTRTVQTISVLGAGTMGHGIAQVAAAAGYKAILLDVDRDTLARGVRSIESNLERGIALGKLTEADRDQTLQHIHGTTKLEQTAHAGLFIEAVPENLALKQEILRQVESIAEPSAIFASNTSSLSISAIAREAERPGNVVGMHFFNPVHIMRLLEIVVGRATSENTVSIAREVGIRMRKEPIVVRDVPGFASSRLGVAIGLEAMRMLEQSVACAADIDKAMELGYNHPMGPLRLSDLVGLDVRLDIAEYLHKELESEVFCPPQILRRMVSEGKLGKKSGEGFYKWENATQATSGKKDAMSGTA